MWTEFGVRQIPEKKLGKDLPCGKPSLKQQRLSNQKELLSDYFVVVVRSSASPETLWIDNISRGCFIIGWAAC